MARSLRPRKARLSYASLPEPGDDVLPEDDGSSSDDFRPADDQEDADTRMDPSDVEPSVSLNHQEDTPSVQNAPRTRKQPKPRVRKETKVISGVPRSAPSARPPNVASGSTVDHRQRAEPLYLRPALVERLTSAPAPFKQPVTTSTPCWNSNKSCAEKLMRAYAYNIGRGPAWELLEDRSWWKESHVLQEGVTETEATRRPRVFESVRVNAFKIISEQEAHEHLPTSAGKPDCNAIKCFFGSPNRNTKKELKIFDTVELLDDPSGSKVLAFNAGGPVWSLDWCPIYAEDHPHRFLRQYIAVAPMPSESHIPHIGQKCGTPYPACIQIWSYSPKFSATRAPDKGKGRATGTEVDFDFGIVACDLVLCIDCGPAQEIKWCPLPANDSWVRLRSGGIGKLGLLAGAFENGTLSIFSVPDPEDLQTPPENRTVYVQVQPIIRVELDETCITSLDWANSERIAVGCTNGSIAVYDIHDALSNQFTQDILPTHYFSIHQSSIRSIRWLPVPNISAEGHLSLTGSPTMIASGGYDGCEIVTDIRDGYGGILNRTRDVALTVTYSRFTEAVVSIDLDNTAKGYAISPGIFGRGSVVMEAGGPIWSLDTSDYHPFLALGSADGSLLIANMLRSTRRSGTTPFLYHKIYQMDYSRKAGEYRMLDQFLPQEIPDRSSVSGKKGSKPFTGTEALKTGVQGTGVWPPEVSVTRASWNNGAGLASAPLLASATASGLCRIDWLLGHFQDDRVPYGGIESIRNEIVTNVKMDEDDLL